VRLGIIIVIIIISELNKHFTPRREYQGCLPLPPPYPNQNKGHLPLPIQIETKGAQTTVRYQEISADKVHRRLTENKE